MREPRSHYKQKFTFNDGEGGNSQMVLLDEDDEFIKQKVNGNEEEASINQKLNIHEVAPGTSPQVDHNDDSSTNNEDSSTNKASLDKQGSDENKEETAASIVPVAEDGDHEIRETTTAPIAAVAEDEAPKRLQHHLQNAKEGIAQVYRDFPSLQPKALMAEVHKLTSELENATETDKPQIEEDLQNKKWSLEHHEETARNEYMLQNPWSVHSLKNNEDGWVAEVWVTNNERVQVEMKDVSVDKLVGCFVSGQDRFKQNVFSRLLRYDRLAEVHETHFALLKQVDKTTFQLTDGCGRSVYMRESWLKHCPNIDAEDIANAKSYYKRKERNPFQLPAKAAGIHNKDNQLAYSLEAAGIHNKDAQLPLLKTCGCIPILYKNTTGRCLQFCLASALHYLGYTRAGRVVAGSKISRVEHLQNFLYLKGKAVHSRARKIKGATKNEWKKYDPLNENHWVINPVVAKIFAFRPMDGGGGMEKVDINHCICFVNGLIFDSNQSHALETSKKNLDVVASLIVKDAVFGGIYWTREMVICKVKK